MKSIHETWKVFTEHICLLRKIFEEVKLKQRKNFQALKSDLPIQKPSESRKFLQVLQTVQRLLGSPSNFVKLFPNFTNFVKFFGTSANFAKLSAGSTNFIKVVCESHKLCKVVGQFCKLPKVVDKFYEFWKVACKF